MCIYIYKYVCMYIFMYIHICTYIYVYINMYIYICVSIQKVSFCIFHLDLGWKLFVGKLHLMSFLKQSNLKFPENTTTLSCNILQHSAHAIFYNILQYPATPCSTLQNTDLDADS